MGRLRSLVIRLSILILFAGILGGAWVAHDYVRPERVREALINTLQTRMPDVDVQVESASLRLFGGISVQGLKLTRKGEPEPFFEAPDASIAHDKESLSRGVVQIRKVEIEGAIIRLARGADGLWNVENLLPASTSDDLPAIPTLVVKNATIFVRDLRPNPMPPMLLTEVKLSLINDPVTLLKIDSSFTIAPKPLDGECKLKVPMTVSAKYHRTDRAVQAHIEIPDLEMTPELAPGFAKIHPAIADYLTQFHAHLAIKADVKIEKNQAPKYELKVDLKDGRFEDESLPWPLDQIVAIVHFKDGKLTVEKASARFGKSAVELALETRSLLPAPATNERPDQLPTKIDPSTPDDPIKKLEDKLERLQLTIRELALDDEFFAKLPAKAHRMRRTFNPTGTVDIGLMMHRTPTGLKQELEVRPNRATMNYEKFKYPVQDLAGHVKKVTRDDGKDEFRVQITGTASQRRIELTGIVGADGLDPLIDLKLTGIDFPIDDKLFAAMPEKYTNSLSKLRAAGRGDFSVEIRQAENVNKCESMIRVSVYDTSVNYEHFPYPLRKIRGKVTIRITAISPERPLRPGMPISPSVDTDRVELRNFEAVHADGKLWLDGEHEPLPNSNDRILKLRVQGENLPFDPDFKNAVAILKIGNLWQTFSPTGNFTFGSEVEIIERGSALPAPPNATAILSNNPSRLEPVAATTALPGEPPFSAASDLKLVVNFKGPSIRPEFFQYDLENLSGVLRYQQGKLDLAWFTARHGSTMFTLDAAEVRFGDNREVWANIGGLNIRPLVIDSELIRALPAKAAANLKELKLRGRCDLLVKHLVIKIPGAATPVETPNIARGQAPTSLSIDPVVYWNAELKLHGANFETGLDWEEVHGTIASVGKYEGDRFGAILGHAWLDRATLYKQPLTNLKMSYRVRPQVPDPARPGSLTPPIVEFPDLTANLYQGTLGGEAWVSLGDVPQFRLWITAAGVKLDELATQTKLAGSGELRGLAQGKLLLENPIDAKSGLAVLTGTGQIDVPNGRMYNLPVLLPMLKLLKLQTPDQTAFEEAHATFDIRGDRVKVSQLDLIGTAVSLGGSGELDMKGEDVRFEFYTIWSQALKRWLSTPFGDVTSYLSGNLFKIEMFKQPGRVMEYRPQMLPVVTEPMRNVLERFRSRSTTTSPAIAK
jgi:hypothetical protein